MIDLWQGIGVPAPVIAQKVMTEEKAPSRGLALVNLDFLIGTKRGSNARRQQQQRPQSRNLGVNEAKSLKNKYFTYKFLFPKDLAGTAAKVFIPQDRK